MTIVYNNSHEDLAQDSRDIKASVGYEMATTKGISTSGKADYEVYDQMLRYANKTDKAYIINTHQGDGAMMGDVSLRNEAFWKIFATQVSPDSIIWLAGCNGYADMEFIHNATGLTVYASKGWTKINYKVYTSPPYSSEARHISDVHNDTGKDDGLYKIGN
ncbi:MAG: hypothetical protein SFY80_15190 [Verrucomicrobiota bacterium]|nr:hypothetical protein [Verrucomicrobiota bacterium]